MPAFVEYAIKVSIPVDLHDGARVEAALGALRQWCDDPKHALFDGGLGGTLTITAPRIVRRRVKEGGDAHAGVSRHDPNNTPAPAQQVAAGADPACPECGESTAPGMVHSYYCSLGPTA